MIGHKFRVRIARNLVTYGMTTTLQQACMKFAHVISFTLNKLAIAVKSYVGDKTSSSQRGSDKSYPGASMEGTYYSMMANSQGVRTRRAC
jgi:hypothetical protein